MPTEKELEDARSWLGRVTRKRSRFAWYVDCGFTDGEIAHILNLTTDDVQRLRDIALAPRHE